MNQKRKSISTAAQKLRQAQQSVDTLRMKRLLAYTEAQLKLKQKDLTVMQDAHNHCIAQLKAEIIQKKSGINFSDLLE